MWNAAPKHHFKAWIPCTCNFIFPVYSFPFDDYNCNSAVLQTALRLGPGSTLAMPGTRQRTWSEERGSSRQVSPRYTCQCYSSPPRNRSRRSDLLRLYKQPSLRHSPIENCISSARRWYHLYVPRSSYTYHSLDGTSRWAGRFPRCLCYKFLDNHYTYSTLKLSLISKEK